MPSRRRKKGKPREQSEKIREVEEDSNSQKEARATIERLAKKYLNKSPNESGDGIMRCEDLESPEEEHGKEDKENIEVTSNRPSKSRVPRPESGYEDLENPEEEHGKEDQENIEVTSNRPSKSRVPRPGSRATSRKSHDKKDELGPTTQTRTLTLLKKMPSESKEKGDGAGHTRTSSRIISRRLKNSITDTSSGSSETSTTCPKTSPETDTEFKVPRPLLGGSTPQNDGKRESLLGFEDLESPFTFSPIELSVSPEVSRKRSSTGVPAAPVKKLKFSSVYDFPIQPSKIQRRRKAKKTTRKSTELEEWVKKMNSEFAEVEKYQLKVV